LTRVFTATDDCGNMATASRTVVWTSDVSPPVFTGDYSMIELGCNPFLFTVTRLLGTATATDDCVSVTISQIDGNVQSRGCENSLTRFFTATDACGNTATISRTVVWTSDVSPPTFTGDYSTVSIGCNPSTPSINSALGSAIATDGCTSLTITFTTGPVQFNGCNRIQTRFFTATDGCGNASTASRTVTWTEKTTFPVIFVFGTPANGVLGCNPSQSTINAALGSAIATDACGVPTITSADGGIQTNGCLRIQARTFTVTDVCGNTVTVTRIATWTSEVTPPVFTGDYSSIQLGCNSPLFRVSRLLGTATATDACGSVTITQSDGVVQSDGCRNSLTRFFIATDACGNVATISRTAVWTSDLTPPTFTGDYSTISLGCRPTQTSINWALGSATAIDACSKLSITASDGVVQSTGCGRALTRFFTATDACGNRSTTSRTATWTDEVTPPVIIVFGGNGILGCNPSLSAINAALGSAIASDGCSAPTVTFADGNIQTNGCLRIQIRTFTATDGCGNTSTASRTVTWTSDVTPPTFTGDYSGIKLGCNPPLFRIGRLLGTATATDACGPVTITQTDGVVQSDGCRNSLTRFFTATDACGNVATISRTAVWTSDLTPPAFTGDYSTVSLGCRPTQSSINSALGSATAIDACSSLSITASDGVVQSTGCGRRLTRFFTATDACDNVSTASRTVTWTDEMTPPAIIAFGTALTMGCNPSPAAIFLALGSATATDGCSAPTVTSTDGSIQINGSLRIQTRTFTATDACGNTSTVSRTATWTSDVTPPVFIGDYSSIDAGCNPFLFRISRLLGTATATDACSSVTITQTDGAVQSNGCRNSLTRFFTATDACGNIATISRTAFWATDGCCALLTNNSFSNEIEPGAEIKLTVKNPQYKNERLTFYGIVPGNFDVVLINSQGQVVANLKKYHNDWSLSKLVPGLYFYNLLYKKESGELKTILGKLVIGY